MDEVNNETLDLSKRGLKKVEKASADDSKPIINLILDHNELQRLDNIDTYTRVESLSICNNFLLRMHGVSRLSNLRALALNNNGILQIEGLKDLTYLKVLKLAGNNIKSIEHLNHNTQLEHLDLSNNQISFIADISYLKSLKHLNLERNRIIDLRQCDRYLPPSLQHLALAHNNVGDLNELSRLAHLTALESFAVVGNPCVAMAGKDKLGFDYRPFVLNWIMSVKTIDGFVVSAIESLKAEWLYSQGKGRHFSPGQQQELCDYLATSCPLTADALETEDQRKLRLILSKAQHHQQQLKDQNSSPHKSKLQSPRMQSRMSPRLMGRSPDRLTSSYHAGRPVTSHADLMSQSLDSRAERRQEREPAKPANQSLEAASKMVPVPESLMSPDYHEPPSEARRPLAAPAHGDTCAGHGGARDERRQIVPPHNISKAMKGSPKLPKSATSSPKLKSKSQERKASLTAQAERLNGKCNGVSCENSDKRDTHSEKDLEREVTKPASNQRRQKKTSTESMAAVTIQKMWRGYRSRNLNKDSLRILHAIQAARARQHIQRLTCDMEATKAALDSERKIQQLQMQAINALWKKVSTLQGSDTQKQKPLDSDDNTAVLRQLTETCFNLQSQVVDLQGSMQEVLRAVSGTRLPAAPAATQTDICAVATPQEERCTWLKRPQSLPLHTAPAAPAPALAPASVIPEPSIDTESTDIERTDSIVDKHTEPNTESEVNEIEDDTTECEEEREKTVIVE